MTGEKEHKMIIPDDIWINTVIYAEILRKQCSDQNLDHMTTAGLCCYLVAFYMGWMGSVAYRDSDNAWCHSVKLLVDAKLTGSNFKPTQVEVSVHVTDMNSQHMYNLHADTETLGYFTCNSPR